MFLFCVFFFFFFQAEDGIRDLYVTGVQTCALPILEKGTGGIQRSRSLLEGRTVRGCETTSGTNVVYGRFLSEPTYQNARGPRISRSEERRVGKECRYRWSRDR